MGLETVHPQVLERLNKRMTVEQFSAAANKLREHDIALRAFVLVKPPFMTEEEAVHWAKRSLDHAFDCGATAVTLIPTRAGNGAVDALALAGEFEPPQLSTVEASMEYGLSLKQGRVFVDLWDQGASAACDGCRDARLDRLRAMNLEQAILARIRCSTCGEPV